jgi:hypothetical protein
MLYECILYKDNIPGDRYSPIVNEDDVTETEKGLRIVMGHTSHYVSHLEYDYYEIYEIDD